MSSLAPPPKPAWYSRALVAFLGLFDRWLRLSCRSFMLLASEQHERPLTLGERLKLLVHRVVCRVCQVQEWRIEQLRSITRDLGHQERPAAEFSAESVEKLRRAMAAAADPKPPTSHPSEQ